MVTEMSTPGQTVETEIKLRLSDPEDGRRRLELAGFQVRTPRLFEANILLDTPQLGLREAGSILRLRQAGSSSILTFKGPSQKSKHKVREELEIGISDLAMAEAIFGKLGYRRVFRYEKYRTEYIQSGRDGIATLDETPIGTFLELEGSSDWIDQEALRLGFAESAYLTISYGQLYRDYCSSRAVSPSDMVFGEFLGHGHT